MEVLKLCCFLIQLSDFEKQFFYLALGNDVSVT